jgi:anti-anti-sigma factor
VPLQISQQQTENGAAVVMLAGRLMLGPDGAEVEKIVKELLSKGVRRIIFDFTGLSHVDSTGIGRCIASLNMVMQAGGKLHIAGAGGQVRDAFRVTQLDRVFRFFDSIPAAEAAF